MPKNITARPTTDFARENIFNVLENIVDFEGARALDLFAGTGAISFEFLSRGCERVVSVEKAATQHAFIHKVSKELGAENHRIIKGDALKYIDLQRGDALERFDIVFADPPYDMPGFGEVPGKVIESGLIAPGGIFIMEHSAKYDFSDLPGFMQRRTYGSVNFSLFEATPNEMKQ